MQKISDSQNTKYILRDREPEHTPS